MPYGQPLRAHLKSVKGIFFWRQRLPLGVELKIRVLPHEETSAAAGTRGYPFESNPSRSDSALESQVKLLEQGLRFWAVAARRFVGKVGVEKQGFC